MSMIKSEDIAGRFGRGILRRTARAGLFLAVIAGASAADPDLIVHHGRIVTVDPKFSIQEAMAIEGKRITQLGSSADLLQTKGPRTVLLDLKGKMVLPGLMDSHAHPLSAAMTEFDHPIPAMETIGDVLAYFRQRAKLVKEGDWLVLEQVFITS